MDENMDRIKKETLNKVYFVLTPTGKTAHWQDKFRQFGKRLEMEKYK